MLGSVLPFYWKRGVELVRLIPEKELGTFDWCKTEQLVVFPVGTKEKPAQLCKGCVDKIIIETIAQKELTEEELKLGWQAIQEKVKRDEKQQEQEEGQEQEEEDGKDE